MKHTTQPTTLPSPLPVMSGAVTKTNKHNTNKEDIPNSSHLPFIGTADTPTHLSQQSAVVVLLAVVFVCFIPRKRTHA